MFLKPALMMDVQRMPLIFAMSVDKPPLGSDLNFQRVADIICCWSVRPVLAKQCWLNACQESCRYLMNKLLWKQH
jgi:hypothetical protein